jgi:hypothetical protein
MRNPAGVFCVWFLTNSSANAQSEPQSIPADPAWLVVQACEKEMELP